MAYALTPEYALAPRYDVGGAADNTAPAPPAAVTARVGTPVA